MLALLTLTAATAAIAMPTAASAQRRAGHSLGEPGQRVQVRHGPGAGTGAHHMRREFRRIDRGQFLPPFWAGPQFHVQHWQSYGFPQPMPGFRWVRYYDDALLVDGRGRVHDGRYGYDWDRHGDRWRRDERGIPAYVGDGDFHPRDRDYAWAEEADEGGWDYSEYGYEEGEDGCGERRRGPCGARRGGPGHGSAGHGGYGYGESGYGYGQSGYGYGYGGATMTITETIVESSGSSVVYEEVIEEEIVETRRARRPVRRAPARRPIRGERG
ncbi:MAG TPA: RcnB family protein [Allosphingosinicella sp.]